jgi:hypothetical protein
MWIGNTGATTHNTACIKNMTNHTANAKDNIVGVTRGTAAMFVGYARDSTHNTMQMYSPDLNSIHETRDVQWSRKIYYEPEKLTQLEAVDSVEIMLNNMCVLDRTNRRVAVQEAARQVGARVPVSFLDEVEIVSLWLSDLLAPRHLRQGDPMGCHQAERGQGMLIEAGQEIEEDFLTMSTSMMNEAQRHTVIQGWDNVRDAEEGRFEQNDEDENGENQTNKEKQEMDQQS